jgi:hypothetical protein
MAGVDRLDQNTRLNKEKKTMRWYRCIEAKLRECALYNAYIIEGTIHLDDLKHSSYASSSTQHTVCLHYHWELASVPFHQDAHHHHFRDFHTKLYYWQ